MILRPRLHPALALSAALIVAGCEEQNDPIVDAGVDAGRRDLAADVAADARPADGGDLGAGERRLDRGPASDGSGATIVDPGPQTIDERQTLTLKIHFKGGSGLFVASGLPPGARFSRAGHTLTFTPDFTQGGRSYTVVFELRGRDMALWPKRAVTITVNDTIKPPTPTISASEQRSGYRRLVITQKTDAFTDSPGHAGRSFSAHVMVPDGASAQNKLPVRVMLHGFGGGPSDSGSADEFRVAPHDPENTYWWGYSDRAPQVGTPAQGTVPPYTQRRVLALLEWVLASYPGADPERVYVTGESMGGAGAKTLGLLRARHFCYVQATIGQAIPRNHRPSRLAQLSGHWGAPSSSLPGDRKLAAWDEMDLTRALRDVPEARQQFVFTKHGRDDPIIHFGAVLHASPLTKLSFYDALQSEQIGHYAVWDEAGHGGDGPVMPHFWSDWGWNRITDATTFLRRDRAFPAFSRSSADQDPGDGQGNGKQPWSAESGYAGQVAVAGDTGWKGAIAGALNRFLRWDASKSVDTIERFELPLKVLDGNGQAAPKVGYPTVGNKLDASLPVKVDVTPRRVQRFHCDSGESVFWRFGSASGIATADKDGYVTVPQLALTTTWQTLVLTRL